MNTKIFSIDITIITDIWKKLALYHLWGVFPEYGNTTSHHWVDSFPSTFCRRDQSQCSLFLLATAIPFSMWYVISASTFSFCLTCGISHAI